MADVGRRDRQAPLSMQAVDHRPRDPFVHPAHYDNIPTDWKCRLHLNAFEIMNQFIPNEEFLIAIQAYDPLNQESVFARGMIATIKMYIEQHNNDAATYAVMDFMQKRSKRSFRRFVHYLFQRGQYRTLALKLDPDYHGYDPIGVVEHSAVPLPPAPLARTISQTARTIELLPPDFPDVSLFEQIDVAWPDDRARLPQGLCLIIQYSRFTTASPAMRPLPQLSTDCEAALVDRFFTQLHYKVRTISNRNRQELYLLVGQELASVDLSRCRAVVTFIISHSASENDFYDSQCQPVPVEDLCAAYDVPQLNDKPRLFFIACCPTDNWTRAWFVSALIRSFVKLAFVDHLSNIIRRINVNLALRDNENAANGRLTSRHVIRTTRTSIPFHLYAAVDQ